MRPSLPGKSPGSSGFSKLEEEELQDLFLAWLGAWIGLTSPLSVGKPWRSLGKGGEAGVCL